MHASSSGRRAVVLLSGGLDSSTLAYFVQELGFNVHAISIDYGQRHVQELHAARNIALAGAFAEHQIVNVAAPMQGLFEQSASSQVGRRVPVPHGHYAAENMKTTIVPNRNMVLIAMATAYAVSINSRTVAYAAHAGDHAIYPDCRPEFAAAIAEAMLLGNDPGVELYRPFIQLTKTDIAREAKRLRVPTHLTYSCYEGREKHCGKCGTCVERIEAFRDAGLQDPTEYETVPV